MATFRDADGVSQWYLAVVVAFRPRARIYRHVVHFDEDGEEICVGFPDDGVQLLAAMTTHCRCPRCMLSEPEGRVLRTA